MPSNEPTPFKVVFASNFESLTLLRHLGKEIEKRAGVLPDLRSSGFGGLETTLSAVTNEELPAARVVALIEWADLDPRLGLRSELPLTRDVLNEIASEGRRTAERLASILERLGQKAVLSLPTLAMPPFFPSRPGQSTSWQVSLRASVSLLAERAVAAGVVLLDTDMPRIPLPQRASPRNDVRFGFPYSEAHARDLADLIAELLVPPPRRKGLVLDLDGTLWRGIVGDDGAAALSWGLDSGAMVHGLLQRVVGLLADSGTLVAIVSKNEPEAAESGLARSDLLLQRESLWPVIASWEQKSSGVRKAAASWNISVEDIAVLDDSTLELAEIESSCPGVLALPFVANDPDVVLLLLQRLRSEFGAARVGEEDALRAASLRSQGELLSVEQSDSANYETFLAGLEPDLRMFRISAATQARALELMNKTNQFNLNGNRVTPATEADFLRTSDGYVVQYADRLARLGIVAVVRWQQTGETITITHWVLSCRAFARRIEHALLSFVAVEAGERSIHIAYEQTAKNAPVSRFFEDLSGAPPVGMFSLQPELLMARLPSVRPTARLELVEG